MYFFVYFVLKNIYIQSAYFIIINIYTHKQQSKILSISKLLIIIDEYNLHSLKVDVMDSLLFLLAVHLLTTYSTK